MGRRVDKWIADDGSEHDSQRGMVLHELALVDAREIDAFLRDDTGKLPKRHREYTRLLTEWQEYMRANDTAAEPMPETVQPVTDKAWAPDHYAFASEAVDKSEEDPFAGAVAL